MTAVGARGRRARWAVAGIVACALLAFATATAGDYIYDDLHSVRDNEAIRSLANIPNFFVDLDTFSSRDVRMYRPVLLVSFALNHALAGGAPWIFKLTNVLLHAGCAALVYSLARCLRAKFPLAVLAGVLFAVHPLASEAINLVSGRSDVMMALGLLLGLRFHAAALRGSRGALIGTSVAAAVACGSKEPGVLLPACLLALELAHARRRGWDLLATSRRLAGPFAVVLGYLVARRLLLGVATAHIPILQSGHDIMHGAGRDLVTQLSTMAYILPRFTGQSVLPVGMSLDPVVPYTDQWWSAPVICGAGFLAILTWLGLRAPRRRPGVFVGTCLAWCSALPWVVVPLNLPACEHRFYGALAGLALVFGCCGGTAWLRSRTARVLAAVLVAAGIATSAHRSLDYRDRESVWQACLDGHPGSIRGLCGMALVRRREAVEARLAGDEEGFCERLREGLRYLERAVGVYPDHRAARVNIAEFNLAMGPERGDPFTAAAMADYLIEREPENPLNHLLLSRALTQAGRALDRADLFAEAERVALGVLDFAEPQGIHFRVAAQARAMGGDLDGAVELLGRAVAEGLDEDEVLLDRGEFLLRLGRHDDAMRDLGTVIGRDPFQPRALRLLARASPR